MAQFSKQRINRVYKRGPSDNKRSRKPRSQAQRQDENPAVVSDDEQPLELSEIDSASDTEARSRPYNTLLNLLEVNPEKQSQSRKRRKISKDVFQAQALSDDDEGDEAASEAESGADGSEAEVDADDEENDLQEEQESDAEDIGGDPFEAHINKPDLSSITSRVQALQEHGWSNSKRAFGKLGECAIYSPRDTSIQNELLELKNPYSAAGIKQKFQEKAKDIQGKSSDASKALSPYILGYSDVLFGSRTPPNAASLRDIACLHAVNHVFKTRDKVVRHNTKLSAAGADSNLEYRDQGFTRPKVLILAPTRGGAGKIIDSIVEIAQAEQQENRKRFEDNFYSADGGQVSSDRPDDFKDLFDGNDDDMFRIGIKFTRKTVKFFAQFYNSDIIVASPLGLRSAIDGGEGKKKDYDYLSSIEILLIDQTDALLQQNWDHITFLMAHLNLSPRESHGCDFSRVRMWSLDDQARYLRQTIVLAAYITPEINALFSKHMQNIWGKVKCQPVYDGGMLTTGLPLKQTFTRFQSSSIQTDPDVRFTFFTSTIIPWLLRQPRPIDDANSGPGILIFIPSYFDYIRVKNYFHSSPTVSSLSFASVTENKSPAEPETRRARSHFLTGKSSVLLYTGRAHHFYRYLIRGVKSVVVYQLPDNALFYQEIVGGFLGASVTAGRTSAEEASARVMFSKWDALRLERVVGTERLRTMLGAGDTFDFI